VEKRRHATITLVGWCATAGVRLDAAALLFEENEHSLNGRNDEIITSAVLEERSARGEICELLWHSRRLSHVGVDEEMPKKVKVPPQVIEENVALQSHRKS